MERKRCGFRSVVKRSEVLARYRVGGRTRLLMVFAHSGRSDIFDVPANGVGSCYWVERGGHNDASREALVAAYLEEAEAVGAPAMSSVAIGAAVGIEVRR